MARRRDTGRRGYARTERLNGLLWEIVGDAIEQSDDDRLELVTVMSVEVQPDLSRATVFWSSVRDDHQRIVEGLAEARIPLQAAIGRQARLKKVPELAFVADPAVRAGERVEEILREIHTDGSAADGDDDARS
ncbi:MAG: 30S ribosome-binding factor RbfA [Acidimicrobiia bacterium]|nr:30S ribosome-binding factor RbfA [Acidimicrobiia bacterium]